MRKKQRGLIPEKAQVPVAIGGAALLLIIVLWRFVLPSDQGAGDTPASPPAVAVASSLEITAQEAGDAGAVPSSDLEAVQTLVTALKEKLVPVAAAASAPPPLVSNPFSPFGQGDAPQPGLLEEEAVTAEEGALIPLEPAGLEALPLVPSEEEMERLDRLAGLRLTATIQSGSWSMAVINGSCYRRGDKVEDFIITEIGEKQVSLKDDQGLETLHIEAGNSAQGPRMTLPAPPVVAVEQDLETNAEELETSTLGELHHEERP